MTCFDRYLLFRYLQVLAILFVSCFGLFVVIDGFSNVDEYQQPGSTALGMIQEMSAYYGYQLFAFFELTGGILSVISVMAVFGMLARKSELYPLLAAGVPIWRLTLPLAAGSLIVSGTLFLNQELILPQIAHRLTSRTADVGKQVEPIFDYERFIHIDGRQLKMAHKKLIEPQITLLAPEVATELTTLSGDEARFFPSRGKRPAGWLITNATPSADQIRLTPRGRKIVHGTGKPGELFIATDISIDQLHHRSSSFKYQSLGELRRRIDNPSFGLISVNSQVVHLHTRLLRPLSNLVVVFLAVPLLVRKESRSMIFNMGICAGVLSLVFVATQACYFLGAGGTISASLAVWLPIIGAGTLSAWLSHLAMT